MMLITYIRWRSDTQLLLSGKYCKYYSKGAGEKEDRISKAGLIDSTEVSLNRNKWGIANTLENPNKCQIKQPLSNKGYVKMYSTYEIILSFHYEYNIHFSSHSLLTTFDTLSRKNVCKQLWLVTWCSCPLKQVTSLNIGTSFTLSMCDLSCLLSSCIRSHCLDMSQGFQATKEKSIVFFVKEWEDWVRMVEFPTFSKRKKEKDGSGVVWRDGAY